jgi:hypothetical protein
MLKMRTMPVSAMPISAMTSVDIRAGTPTYMDYNTLAKDIYETAKREKWPQQKLTHMLNNPKDFQKIVKKVTTPLSLIYVIQQMQYYSQINEIDNDLSKVPRFVDRFD